MTMPVTNTAPEMPELSYPRIMLMSTDGVDDASHTVKWAVGDKHPFASIYQIVAMYVVEPFVEVYSISGAAKAGIRDLIPIQRIRFAREHMPMDIFAEELGNAEIAADEEDDNEPEPEPELLPAVS